VPAAGPARQCVAAILLLLASLISCVAVYLAWTAPGPWLGASPTLRWAARELSITRGSARQTRDGLVVTAPDAARSVVISLNTSFRARDYPVIAWHAANVPDGVEATLLWYTDLQGSRVLRHTIAVEGGRLLPVSVASDPGWLGTIGGLALVLQGNFAEPIVIRGAAAEPMGALQVLGDRLREWLAFEGWTAASINGLASGADREALPLPALLAAGATLAALIYAALWRWTSRFLGATPVIGLAAILVAASIVADGRWQWNLAREAVAAWDRYGARSWEQRHRAAEDGALFDFIERVRNKLPNGPARLFMAADLAYFRARGAYHLYPHNVYYDPASPAIPPPGVVRSGDYLVVYQRRGVQYDAAERRLRWDGFPPVEADLVLSDAGAALFEIR